MQAIRYLGSHRAQIEYSSDSEWLTERFGALGTALRPVDSIKVRRGLSDELLRQVALLDEVKGFDIGGPQSGPITDSGIAALASLRHLEILAIGQPLDIEGDIDFYAPVFAARPPLRIVEVDNFRMSIAALVELTKIESLERVNVSVENLTRESFRNMRPLPNLQSFALGGDNDVDVHWLRGSPLLTELVLPQQLSDDDMRQIGELKQLNYLAVGSTVGIEHLTQLTSLHMIGLHPKAITPTSVELLRRLPRLSYVMLSSRLEDRDLLEDMKTYWRVEEP
jgi:hypothetical protein